MVTSNVSVVAGEVLSANMREADKCESQLEDAVAILFQKDIIPAISQIFGKKKKKKKPKGGMGRSPLMASETGPIYSILEGKGLMHGQHQVFPD